MAIIKKTQIRPEDGNDYETILYPETSTDMVIDEATGKSIATLAGTPGGFATLDNEGNIPKEHLIKAPRVEILFGNGTDGNVTISSNTTLTRDMYYNNLTINNGRTLKTNGFKIFVKGTLTNNGTIENNGLDGGNATSDGQGTHRSTDGPYAGGSGGDGGRSADPYSNPGSGRTSNFDEYRFEFELIHRLYDTKVGNGGNGGSGRGYADNIYSWGGGGGGGGEKIHIYAKRLINNGSIQSKGGNGGNGHANSVNFASGGGGGGGGGVVLLVYEEFNGNDPDVSGGQGGTGGGSSSSTYRGKNGEAGRVIKIKLI